MTTSKLSDSVSHLNPNSLDKLEPMQTAPSHMKYIDALRGGACLWVLLHHSLEHYPVAKGLSHLPLRLLVMLANIGWLGVSLFLVLSGFCLYYPLVRRAETAAVRLDIKAFARRRAWRILPPYYAAMAAYLVLYHPPLQMPVKWNDVLMHGLMLHNLSPATIATINGPLWSLALESQLYLVFPLLVLLAARRGLGHMLTATFVIAVIWQTAIFFHLGVSHYYSPVLAVWYHALPGRCFEFAVGMTAAAIAARPKPHVVRYAAITICVLVVPAIGYAVFVSRFGPLLDQIWGVLFGCSLVLLQRVPSWHFQSNVALRALTWVGSISYSLYLTHRLVFYYIHLHGRSDPALVLWTFARIGLAIAVSYFFFLMFELPFLSRRSKITGGASSAA